MTRFWNRGVDSRAATLLLILLVALNATAQADDAATDKHLLKYKFAKGEVVRMEVLHLATTETRIRGNLQTSRSRGSSVKEWEITKVADDGSFTFEHRVASAEMSSEVSGRPKVIYNSATNGDKEVPAEYKDVADSLGKTIAIVTVTPNGEIVKQENTYRQYNFGLGQMVFPLPKEPIAVGHEWHFPVEITTSLRDGTRKRIKTRQRYTLTKVAHGIATIDVVTQVLTPIDDPQIEVQLMQQLTKGKVRFDIDAGRVIYQRMDWDEKAVGFNGADSVMEYLARFEEKILDDDAPVKVSEKPAASPTAGPAKPVATAGPAKPVATAKKPSSDKSDTTRRQ